MRETRADTRVAVVGALALHALLFALLFVGMWWTRTAAPVSAAGPEDPQPELAMILPPTTPTVIALRAPGSGAIAVQASDAGSYT